MSDALIARCIARLVPSLPDYLDAEDAEQTARLALWCWQQRHPGVEMDGAYINRIARSAVIDLIRTARGRTGTRRYRDTVDVSLAMVEHADERFPDVQADDPAERAIGSVDAAILLQDLRGLPAKHLTALRLRAGGLGFREIGARLGVCPTRAGQYLRDVRTYATERLAA